MPGLDVHLVTPEREVWAGEADFVIARSVVGDVGVLAGHAPTLAALDVGVVHIEVGGQRTLFAVDGGFLHIGHADHGTRVDLLAERAVPQDELDGEETAERERLAERLRAEGNFADARTEAAKASIRRRLTQ